VQQFRDERDAALESYNEALKLYKEIGDRLGEAITYRRLGHLQLSNAQIKNAQTNYLESLVLCQKIEDRLGEAYALRALGDIAFYHYDFIQARKNYEKAIGLFRRIGDSLGDANSVMSLIRLDYFQNSNFDTIQQKFDYVIQIRRKMNDLASEGEDYLGFAAVLTALESWTDANDYISRAKRAFQDVGEEVLFDVVSHFEQGMEKIRLALAESHDKQTVKESLLEAKREFTYVGDFLLFMYLDRMIASYDT
jgi:tetratricopeptide (TPR) repeat protein